MGTKIAPAEDSLSTAQRMFTMAIKIAPYYTDAYYNRGLCFEKANKLKEALKDYKQSLNFKKINTKFKKIIQNQFFCAKKYLLK